MVTDAEEFFFHSWKWHNTLRKSIVLPIWKIKLLARYRLIGVFFSSSWEANCGLIITGNLSSKYYPAAKALVTVWVVVKLKHGIARYRVPRNKASPRARVLVFYSKPSSFWLITEPLRKSSHIHRNPDSGIVPSFSLNNEWLCIY